MTVTRCDFCKHETNDSKMVDTTNFDHRELKANYIDLCESCFTDYKEYILRKLKS